MKGCLKKSKISHILGIMCHKTKFYATDQFNRNAEEKTQIIGKNLRKESKAVRFHCHRQLLVKKKN